MYSCLDIPWSGSSSYRSVNCSILAWYLCLKVSQNRQGKTRLSKWYVPYDDDEKVRLRGEVHRLVAPRDQKYQSNFVEVCLVVSIWEPRTFFVNESLFRTLRQFRNYKIVYRRYAGLFFCVCVDASDNELAYLEAIHLFVEVLGRWPSYLHLVLDHFTFHRLILW